VAKGFMGVEKTKENLMVIEDPEKGNIVYDLT
jgi:hypothetical protein